MANELAKDAALVGEFVAESEELLQRMDQDMIALEAAPSDSELLARVFRTLHTIKGTSGFLGFEAIVRLSHRAEDVLNALRKHEVTLNQRMIDALLSARDYLGRMFEDIRNNRPSDYQLDALAQELETLQKPVQATPRLGEILVSRKLVDSATLQKGLAEACESGRRLGEVLVEQGTVTAAQIGEALADQKTITENASPASSMRVDVRKLDELINLIGELVLERNRLVQLSRNLANQSLSAQDLGSTLAHSTAHLSFLTDELQTAGLKTRMVPIENVFRKFPRLVRDLARTLKKEVELVMKGQDTEIDKTVVELVGDPLVHLIRNSLDHGIELPQDRVGAGKPRQGTIQLEARQEGDQIVVRVIDDGAGIDPDRVARKAVQKGLIAADSVCGLSSREILDFVFLPGFTTTETASDISGRGVGMDVVRTNLKKLNGTIELDSRVGLGTTVVLKLPLTLAILPVLLVRLADEIYGLPLRAVVETARVSKDQVHIFESREVLQLREQTLPLIRLGPLFELPARIDGESRVVVLAIAESRVAVLVDELIGQESTVVKPLGAYLHGTSLFAGGTIAGDGRIRLVLDPAAVVASAGRQFARGV